MTEERKSLLANAGQELKNEIKQKMKDFSEKHKVVVRMRSVPSGMPSLELRFNQDDLDDPNEIHTALIIN